MSHRTDTEIEITGSKKNMSAFVEHLERLDGDGDGDSYELMNHFVPIDDDDYDSYEQERLWGTDARDLGADYTVKSPQCVEMSLSCKGIPDIFLKKISKKYRLRIVFKYNMECGDLGSGVIDNGKFLHNEHYVLPIHKAMGELIFFPNHNPSHRHDDPKPRV